MLNSLPKTSSVKMIDVWVVFNLMVPFFEIILKTLLYKLENEVNGRDEDGDRGKPCLHGSIVETYLLNLISTVEKPQLQVKSDSSDKVQKKNTHEDEVKGNDVPAERDWEMERRKSKVLTKMAPGRYLLVNIIKFVLPGVYTLFCFIFFLIGLLFTDCRQIT